MSNEVYLSELSEDEVIEIFKRLNINIDKIINEIIKLVQKMTDAFIKLANKDKKTRKRVSIYYRTKTYRIKKKQRKLIFRGMQALFV